MSIPVEVFTDGACAGNPGPGGWAWAIAPDGHRHGSGGAARTTNQRMEVQAVLEALKVLGPEGAPITIVSDSTYVVHCFRDRWYVKWQSNGWKNSKKEPVANADLWAPLIELVLRHTPQFRWVKGHSGNAMNDYVDRLAVAASQGPFDPPPPAAAQPLAASSPRSATGPAQAAPATADPLAQPTLFDL